MRINLHDLSSSSERAGAVGLILHAEHMKRRGDLKGIYEVVDVTSTSFTLNMNADGLASAFDDLFAGALVEVKTPTIKKDKNKEVIQPLRTEESVVETDKGPSTKKPKKLYVYETEVPRGSLLSDLPPSWLKLHRDMLYMIHNFPTQRLKFQRRIRGLPTTEASKEWKCLEAGGAWEINSSLLLGAQAANADGVSFKVPANNKFLLNFWPLVAQAYRLRVMTDLHKDNPKSEVPRDELLIVVPDVLDFEGFSRAYTAVLKARRGVPDLYMDEDGKTHDNTYWGTPRKALVSLNEEGALQFGHELRLALDTLSRATESELVSGFDLFHLKRGAKTIGFERKIRFNPTTTMCGEYYAIVNNCWDYFFRRQRVANLINNAPWHSGLGRLCEILPKDSILGRNCYFRRDSICSLGLEA